MKLITTISFGAAALCKIGKIFVAVNKQRSQGGYG